MAKPTSKIRFTAKLLQPAEATKGDSWTFLTLPKDASRKLPSRGMTTVEGTINGISFRATLEPDGQKSHWLKVDRKLREAASAEAGDESDASGKYFSNFYGGVIMSSSLYDRVTKRISVRNRLNLFREAKWPKVSEPYLSKYQQLIKAFFDEARRRPGRAPTKGQQRTNAATSQINSTRRKMNTAI